MRKDDPFRDQTKVKDFLTAMLMSCEFVAKRKDHIDHVPVTIGHIQPYVADDTEEADMRDALRKYL